MSGDRLVRAAAVALALAALGGCGPRHADAGAGASATTAAAAHERAPQDPDLAAIMERFYQQVEGEHWAFADGMLSQGYRTAIGLDGVRPMYKDLADLDVSLQQTAASTVVANLSARDPTDRTRRLRYRETVRLLWDNDQWAIDLIARRDVSSGTR